MRKTARYFLILFALISVLGGMALAPLGWAEGPAQAGLSEAHKQALAVYKKTKDPLQAIKVLENAGIKAALGKQPVAIKHAAYISLLNDYGFLLAEAADTTARRGQAIDVLETVIALSPDRVVAYLNLGDVYVKEIDANADSGAKQEFRELALTQYKKYAELLESKKLSAKMPARVRAFLERASAHGKKTYRYELVMNKEKENGGSVCTHMLSLYNADFQEIGRIEYSKHPEFSAFNWKQMDNLSEALADKQGEIWLSRFDIDNDGKVDLIVKVQWSLHGTLGDELYIYSDSEGSPPLREVFGVEDLERRNGEIIADVTYDLDGISDSKERPMIVAPYILAPFQYKGRTYISGTDHGAEFEHAIYEREVTYENWLVIARYKKGTVLENICYLKLVSQAS